MKDEFEALEYLRPFRLEDKKAKEAYDILKKVIVQRNIYFKALCDIEDGEDVKKVLERTLT